MKQKELWNQEYKLKKDVWKRETRDVPVSLKNKKVLELGVGNGKTLISILKQKPSKVVAIDYSKEAVKICKGRFKQENVGIFEDDIINMTFEDNYFDFVIAYYVLDNLNANEREKAVHEIKRVLKKKGKIVFEDFASEDFREKKKTKFHKYYFKEEDIREMFKSFKVEKIEIKSYFPFKGSKEKRSIVRGVFEKVY